MVPAFSLLATLATLGTAAAVVHPYTAPVLVPVLSTAENQKGFQTFSVQSRLDDQFVSVQHCLPIQLTLKEAKGSMGAAPIFALVDVNTTSLDGSYTIHPLVENKQLVRLVSPTSANEGSCRTKTCRAGVSALA